MATERQIPGGAYVNQTGTRQAQIPGSGYVNENVSTGVTITCTVGNATANGVTASIFRDVSINCSVGNATASGLTATINNANGVTISCSIGNATANGVQATIYQGISIACSVGNASANGLSATITNNPIRIVTEPFINNTETGVLASTAVFWSWMPSGRIGSLSGVVEVDGTGTTAANGTLTVTGLSAGSGILMVAKRNTDATDDEVFYYAGTVA